MVASVVASVSSAFWRSCCASSTFAWASWTAAIASSHAVLLLDPELGSAVAADVGLSVALADAVALACAVHACCSSASAVFAVASAAEAALCAEVTESCCCLSWPSADPLEGPPELGAAFGEACADAFDDAFDDAFADAEAAALADADALAASAWASSSEASRAFAASSWAWARVTAALSATRSSRASTWPAFTVSPTFTPTLVTVPDVGNDRSARPAGEIVPESATVCSTSAFVTVAVRYDAAGPVFSAYAA